MESLKQWSMTEELSKESAEEGGNLTPALRLISSIKIPSWKESGGAAAAVLQRYFELESSRRRIPIPRRIFSGLAICCVATVVVEPP